MLWASFPPIHLWPLAWVAPLPWLLLVRFAQLSGRRPYWVLYGVGFLHWLVLVQWVRLGHWAAHFGWIAIALYLAAYLPAFVWLSRVAVHRFRLPLPLAAAVIWVGLEVLRGWLLTGFSMVLLAHTQVQWLPLFQISDLFGAYGVSFVMIFVSACLAEIVPLGQASCPAGNPKLAGWKLAPLIPAVLVMAAVLAYGYFRLHQAPDPQAAARTAKISLVQGSIDTVFGDETLDDRTLKQYVKLSREAAEAGGDLVVWPESTFPPTRITYETLDNVQPPRWFQGDARQFHETVRHIEKNFAESARRVGYSNSGQRVPVLVGALTLGVGPHEPKRYNSAVMIDAEGNVTGSYYKMHPVMFGEYVPGGQWFPWLYKLTPFPVGLTAGTQPVVFPAGELLLSPSICYENTVPHLIRRQVARLRSEGQEPDVLVTLSNDGWFRGSSELDMHLACGIFRAVELRKPAVIAANTGFSAHIDGNGRVLKKGPRRKTDKLHAVVQADGRSSLYSRTGDLLGNACLALCVVLAAAGWWTSRRE